MRLLIAAAKDDDILPALKKLIFHRWGFGDWQVQDAASETELVLLAPRSDVVLYVRGFPARDEAALLYRLRQQAPSARVVLLAGPRDEEGQRLMDAAIGCGIFNILVADDDGTLSDLDALRALLAGEREMKYEDVAHLHTQVAVPAPPEPEPEQARRDEGWVLRIPVPEVRLPLGRREGGAGREGGEARSAPQAPLGVVAAVLGASGGVGRTTTAANLAVALAAAGRRVAALDLSLPAPDLADCLGVTVYAPGRWEALRRGEAPAVVLVPGGEAGVAVLPGPTLAEREALVAVHTDALLRFVQQLRLDYDYIVIDTAADPLDPLTALAAQQARLQVFVTDASTRSIKRLGLALNGPWAEGGEVRAVVVTRARPEIGRDAEAVLRELAVRPALVAADSPQLYWPSAAGQPVAGTNTPDGQAWRKLAARLDTLFAPAAEAAGRGR